jgi:hypothetical protein
MADESKTPSEGTRAQQRDAGYPEGEKRPPLSGGGSGSTVQYGSEESLRAAVPGGRDEAPHTAQGDVAPEASGRGASGADDRFVSSEVQERAAERGPRTSKTTS